MSIQSDMEIFSVQALERYARQHNLPTAVAANLFYKHQVFEKILIQHEYLHQLDLEDTMNYVEEISLKMLPNWFCIMVLLHYLKKLILESPKIGVILEKDFTAQS